MLACGALDPPPLGTLGETVHQTVWGRINYTSIGLSLHPRPRHIPREAVLGDMAGCVCWGWSLESGGKALGLRHSHSEDREEKQGMLPVPRLWLTGENLHLDLRGGGLNHCFYSPGSTISLGIRELVWFIGQSSGVAGSGPRVARHLVVYSK